MKSPVPLTGGTECCADQLVQCVLLVGIWQDHSMILSCQVGLHSLSVLTSSLVDVLTLQSGVLLDDLDCDESDLNEIGGQQI
jgi:hypothetical protein